MIHTITPAQLRLVRRQQRQRRMLIAALAECLQALNNLDAEQDANGAVQLGRRYWPLMRDARAVLHQALEDGD